LVVGRVAGTALVLLPVLLTWSNDIAAFAFGRWFGRQRLVPAGGPRKTVAGARGGLVWPALGGGAVAGTVFPRLALVALPLWSAVVFGTSISLAAQVGDLFESLLKREAGAKDSSRLFPGHGGVLDRLDSLFFVLPVAYILLAIPGFLVPVPA